MKCRHKNYINIDGVYNKSNFNKLQNSFRHLQRLSVRQVFYLPEYLYSIADK